MVRSRGARQRAGARLDSVEKIGTSAWLRPDWLTAIRGSVDGYGVVAGTRCSRSQAGTSAWSDSPDAIDSIARSASFTDGIGPQDQSLISTNSRSATQAAAGCCQATNEIVAIKGSRRAFDLVPVFPTRLGAQQSDVGDSDHVLAPSGGA